MYDLGTKNKTGFDRVIFNFDKYQDRFSEIDFKNRFLFSYDISCTLKTTIPKNFMGLNFDC